MSLFCFFLPSFLPSFLPAIINNHQIGINNLPIINRWAYIERGPKMVLLGGWLANERSERSFFLAIERISGIKSDKKILGVTPLFLRSKILNNHQLGMNNPSIIYLTTSCQPTKQIYLINMLLHPPTAPTSLSQHQGQGSAPLNTKKKKNK